MAKSVLSHVHDLDFPASLKATEDKSIVRSRQDSIDQAMAQGGAPLLELAKKYGSTEAGEPVRFSNWFEEVILLVGDLRIAETWTTGCAQLGKTLTHTLVLCACISNYKLSAMWAYDRQVARDKQTKVNFWPVIQGPEGNGGWLAAAGIKRRSLGSSQNVDIYQIPGAGSVQFPYASTSDSRGSGLAAVGSVANAVSVSILFKEERSKFAPGTSEVFNRRLDASRIETKPIRSLGTPGGGLGIESEIDSAQYHFYPHCRCLSCDRAVPLDPFGAFLKPETRELPNGELEQVFLSESGRPLAWHHKDPTDPIQSAYFGCDRCASELASSAREKAWYQCLNTGMTLRDYVRSLPSGAPARRQTAAIEITPLLRIERSNTAARLIEEGLTSTNTEDYCQQALGKPSSFGAGTITIALIKRAIGAPVPDRAPDCVIAGIDQARRDGDHLWVQRVWMPDGHERLSIAEKKEQSIRQVIFCGAIKRSQLRQTLDDLGVTYGLIDGEPEISDADAICRDTVLDSADQEGSPRAMKNAQIVPGIRESGGERFRYWKIRQKDFQNDVLYLFLLKAADGHPLIRLGPEWENHIALYQSERSPVRHLTAMSRNLDTRLWEKPADGLDGSFYAAMFAEAAFTIWMSGDSDRPFRNIELRSLSKDEEFDWLRR
jgi:hypothetical protein